MNIRFEGTCGHQIDMVVPDNTTDDEIHQLMHQDCVHCNAEDTAPYAACVNCKLVGCVKCPIK